MPVYGDDEFGSLPVIDLRSIWDNPYDRDYRLYCERTKTVLVRMLTIAITSLIFDRPYRRNRGVWRGRSVVGEVVMVGSLASLLVSYRDWLTRHGGRSLRATAGYILKKVHPLLSERSVLSLEVNGYGTEESLSWLRRVYFYTRSRVNAYRR